MEGEREKTQGPQKKDTRKKAQYQKQEEHLRRPKQKKKRKKEETQLSKQGPRGKKENAVEKTRKRIKTQL